MPVGNNALGNCHFGAFEHMLIRLRVYLCMTWSYYTHRGPESLGPGRELLHGFLNFPEEDGILQELNPLTLVLVSRHVLRSVVAAEARQPRED